MEHLRGNNIKSYHPGDPDMDACDEFFEKNPEVRRIIMDRLSLPPREGSILIFGTGGNMKSDFNFKQLFTNPDHDGTDGK